MHNNTRKPSILIYDVLFRDRIELRLSNYIIESDLLYHTIHNHYTALILCTNCCIYLIGCVLRAVFSSLMIRRWLSESATSSVALCNSL